MPARLYTRARRAARRRLGGILGMAAILLLVGGTPRIRACYTVVVGKNASADGAVLVGHNEQNTGRRILNFRRIPRQHFDDGATLQLRRGGELPEVRETHAFLWSENPELEYSDSYLNENGVAIVSNGCPTREDDYDTLVRRGEIRDGGIGYRLRRLVAERAETARQGVEIAGELIERFGYVDSGRTYTIADPNEAWLLAVVRGRHWVARRVPDDCVVLLPNVHIIADVDLKDSRNVLASPDLIDYAVKRGWFDPAGGEPFDFGRVYRATPGDPADRRQFRGLQIVTGMPMKWSPRIPLPFAVSASRKLGVADVIGILRDAKGPEPICKPSTQEGAVFQLRSRMPREVGCVYWRTTAEPCAGVLTPWYLGITETPRCYYRPVEVETQLALRHHFSPPNGTFKRNPDLAWWKFMTLQNVVREKYEERQKIVRSTWNEFEKRLFAEQKNVEERALKTWEKDREAARAYLTTYCSDTSLRACREADDLASKMRVQR